MRPAKYDMQLNRGGTFKISFTAKDDDVDINFESVYAGARLQVRPSWVKSQEDITGDPLCEWTTDTGEITISGLAVTLELTAAATAALSFHAGSYELELYTDDTIEKVDKFMYGAVTVDFERTV